MSTLLAVENLDAHYGAVQVLHGVSCAVREGSVTAVLGANGAGKTTLLRAISGMVRTAGSVRLAGTEIRGRRTEWIAAAGVAHVPDGRGTLRRLSVDENLRVGAYTRRDRSRVAADVERMFAYFPRLRERRRQQAGTLSGGEQQMLAISRALLLRPRLLLLDEPSFGLAPLVIQEIFGMMRAVSEEERIAILLVEQNVAQALALASDVYLFETGRVVLHGSARDFLANEAVRRSYLGA